MNKLSLTQAKWLKENLPANHNEQDVEYLKARYAWMHAKGFNTELWNKCLEAYQGTTFQLRVSKLKNESEKIK